MSKDDLLEQIKSDNEDIKLKLDAILNALILPRLGDTKGEIRRRIESQVRGELARKVWNSINGQRAIADISKRLKRKRQVVLRYIKRWEQTSPPLVYVCKMKEGAKIYRRIFESNFKKPQTEKKPEKKKETQEQSEEG